ncbi:hypothetical protein Glove_303g105 [Diversispora epigaea]|uniref:Uncharacterized protein n=1 Tax=Diversispora epigaea TaxID=1348612 RepID=A0A397I0P4_9GLOM|nr:hypothetical protein Glove_303g105 [Diversispora epigaea]
MSEQNMETFIKTPTEIAIEGLQAQVKELQEIISGLKIHDTFTNLSPPPPKEKEQKEKKQNSQRQIEALQIENSKFKFRIKHLLTALDKKDEEISQLKKYMK